MDQNQRWIDLIEKQLELETLQAGLGFDRYWKEVTDREEKHDEGSTLHGRKMLGAGVPLLAEKIDSWVKDALSGKAGRKNSAALAVSQVEVHVAAFLTLKALMDSTHATPKLQKVVRQVGRLVELEIRFTRFQDKAKPLYQKVLRQVKQQPYLRANTVLVYVANKFKVDPEWEPWSNKQRIAVGLALTTMAVECLGWWKIEMVHTRARRSYKVVMPTEQCMAIIDDVHQSSALLSPFWLPMVVPPKPWTGVTGGGYLSDVVPAADLIKTPNKEYLTEVESHKEDMPEVFTAINAIQETPWRINEHVLETMRGIWETGGGIAGMPSADNKLLPPKPADIAYNSESLTAWKHEASKVHAYNTTIVSKRFSFSKVIWIADRMKEFDAIYFPHQLDFRGRCYPMPRYLNPQGQDAAKACLTFAEGKPIETPEQAEWLAVHGANCWGEDKVPFKDRVQWVVDHTEDIKGWATDPLNNLGWAEADEPFCFLAFCFEWDEFLEEGYGYVSHLPVAMDGSNNGLQNFAAMLRDEVSGEAVNLIPSDEPQDIYQVVADKTNEVLKDRAAKGDKQAADWLVFGVDRKCTKRPVMVLPYGAKEYACRQYIQDYVNEKVAEGSFDPFDGERLNAALYLSKIVWSAIGETVVAAREAMDWLQDAARVVSKANLPITWTTPTGFPVYQAYTAYKLNNIETSIGHRLQLRVPVPTHKLNKRKQASGISPNFVHSLDASHMMRSINFALKEGINAYAMIHDSYGTHAADTPVLARCLREGFVDIYSQDVLGAFANSLNNALPPGKALPEMPKIGSLHLESVLEAKYFFA